MLDWFYAIIWGMGVSVALCLIIIYIRSIFDNSEDNQDVELPIIGVILLAILIGGWFFKGFAFGGFILLEALFIGYFIMLINEIIDKSIKQSLSIIEHIKLIIILLAIIIINFVVYNL